MRGSLAFLYVTFYSLFSIRSTTTKGFTMFFPFLSATIVGAGAVKTALCPSRINVLTAALQALIFAEPDWSRLFALAKLRQEGNV